MTFGEILFWLLIAILAYLLFKVSIAVLIVAIIIIVIIYIINLFRKPAPYFPPERFQSMKQYSEYLNDQQRINIHTDSNRINEKPYHWYINAHQYFDEKQNEKLIPINCNIANSVSEYCVNKHLQNNDDLNNSITRCTIPPKTSVSCLC